MADRTNETAPSVYSEPCTSPPPAETVGTRPCDSEQKTMISQSASAPCVPAPTKDKAAGCDAVRSRFPDGKWYACNDPETLTHDTVEGALEEYLDGWAEKDCDMAALIREHSPIVVKAYNPMEVTDKQIERWSESLLEDLGERWCDYADPEESPIDLFPADCDKVMLEAVRSIIRRARVWACEEVGRVTLAAEEVEALAREAFPYWFEETTPAPEVPRIVRFKEKA